MVFSRSPLSIRLVAVILFILLLFMGICGYGIWEGSQPYRVGVLLPASGDSNMDFYLTLHRTVDELNREGIGRPVELFSYDTSMIPLRQAADELIVNPDIRVVIGPATSDEIFSLAPDFIRAKKLLITPSATAGDLSRMFGKYGYIWRTAQGDRIQTRLIMDILSGQGSRNVSLLYENSTYGTTFYEWAGYYAIETGITITNLVPFTPGTEYTPAVMAACADDPDSVIVVARGSDAAAILEIMGNLNLTPRPFFTDAARTATFPAYAGPDAEGMEGVSPTGDPTTGFLAEYLRDTGSVPTDYAAPTHDALILAVSTLARMDYNPGESPATAIRAVLSGRDRIQIWDAEGAATAIRMIRSGRSPDLIGASGPLDYPSGGIVDPEMTWYVHWRVENGTFVSSEYIPCSAVEQKQDQVLETRNRIRPESDEPSGEKYAVIVTTSTDWENYRHQADALWVYRLLTDQGIEPDHITLISQEDIPVSGDNPLPGNLHHTIGGENIYRPGIAIPGHPVSGSITTESLVSFLLGNATPDIPSPLNTDENSTLLLYIIGHGGPGYYEFPGEDLPREQFQETIRKMAEKNRFSRMLIVADTCFGESMGTGLDIPGVVYLTGSAADEPAKGTEYDVSIRQWLSDDFTMTLTDIIEEQPDLTLRQVYEMTSDRLSGSHARIIAADPGDLDIPISQFFSG